MTNATDNVLSGKRSMFLGFIREKTGLWLSYEATDGSRRLTRNLRVFADFACRLPLPIENFCIAPSQTGSLAILLSIQRTVRTRVGSPVEISLRFRGSPLPSRTNAGTWLAIELDAVGVLH